MKQSVSTKKQSFSHSTVRTLQFSFKMSPEEENIALAAAAYIILSKKKKKRKHKFWIRPSLQERNQHGGLQLLDALRRDDLMAGQITDGHIQNFLRISSTDLEWLLCRIEPIISKSDTNYRASISAIERLLVTLRFLGTGDSYHSLMYLFRISTQSISKIVPEVCKAIVEVLSDQLKVSNN